MTLGLSLEFGATHMADFSALFIFLFMSTSLSDPRTCIASDELFDVAGPCAGPPRSAIRPLRAGLNFAMTVVVKDKKQLVVPSSVNRRAGIKPGDRLEFKVSGGIINIIPILPSADDEYTPARRHAIDAQLKEAAKGP